VEVRRGPGGEAGRLEADDPQLHGEVCLPALRQHGVIYRKQDQTLRPMRSLVVLERCQNYQNVLVSKWWALGTSSRTYTNSLTVFSLMVR
jgi:hypothetical protein